MRLPARLLPPANALAVTAVPRLHYSCRSSPLQLLSPFFFLPRRLVTMRGVASPENAVSVDLASAAAIAPASNASAAIADTAAVLSLYSPLLLLPMPLLLPRLLLLLLAL